jgi:hypothetical protein
MVGSGCLWYALAAYGRLWLPMVGSGWLWVKLICVTNTIVVIALGCIASYTGCGKDCKD